MDTNLITFGKYKGQPIEILATDKEYLEWLISQSWFKEKYINIYHIVVNNFREIKTETPEHNALQIKFLNINYCLKLAYLINNSFFNFNSNHINKCITNETQKEKVISAPKVNNCKLVNREYLIFEKGFDVQFEISYGVKIPYFYKPNHITDYTLAKELEFNIEIKPTISDDFPAVLRQITSAIKVSSNSKRAKNCLVVGEYTGIGASKEDFITYFESQGITVIFEKEIEQIILPDYEENFIFKPAIRSLPTSG